jgi:hypothetical protein
MRAAPSPGVCNLPPATRRELAARAERIKSSQKRCLMEVGAELKAAKKLVSWGQFEAWVERECGMSPRTAQLIMQAHDFCVKNENFSLLGRSALFILGARDVPAATLAAIDARIRAGDVPSYSDVRAMTRDLQRPSPVTLAAKALQAPARAQIVDLKTERVLRAADAIIAGADPDLKERCEQFRAEIDLTDIALNLREWIGDDRTFACITLLRKRGDDTLAELAKTLEALPPPTAAG